MIIPPVSGVGVEPLLKSGGTGGVGVGQTLSQGIDSSPGLAAEGLPTGGGVAPVSGEPAGFGGALTKAISSLEQTQQSAAGAAQELAMGTVSDPESAIVTVEDAQLAMQLASQIRTKATEAAQTIFQTQV